MSLPGSAWSSLQLQGRVPTMPSHPPHPVPAHKGTYYGFREGTRSHLGTKPALTHTITTMVGQLPEPECLGSQPNLLTAG